MTGAWRPGQCIAGAARHAGLTKLRQEPRSPSVPTRSPCLTTRPV